MSEPQRIHQKRVKGWRKPEGAVSVVRGTDWGNPFKVGDTLWHAGTFGRERVDIGLDITPALAVAMFETWVTQNGYAGQIRDELAGRDLMCFCKPGEPCHADVLLRIANSPADRPLVSGQTGNQQ